MKVIFWNGTHSQEIYDRQSAVEAVKAGLSQWMNPGDSIYWFHEESDKDHEPSQAQVYNSVGEETNASAKIIK